MPGTKHDEGWIQLHWLDLLLGILQETFACLAIDIQESDSIRNVHV